VGRGHTIDIFGVWCELHMPAAPSVIPAPRMTIARPRGCCLPQGTR